MMYCNFHCNFHSNRLFFVQHYIININTHRHKVFAIRKDPGGGGNTPEENLQYLVENKRSRLEEIIFLTHLQATIR